MSVPLAFTVYTPLASEYDPARPTVPMSASPMKAVPLAIGVTVTVALPLTVPGVGVTVSVGGSVDGAVYNPPLVIDPPAPAPPLLVTDQTMAGCDVIAF